MMTKKKVLVIADRATELVAQAVKQSKLLANKKMYQAGFPVMAMEENTKYYDSKHRHGHPHFQVNQEVARKVYEFLSEYISEFWLIFLRNNFIDCTQMEGCGLCGAPDIGGFINHKRFCVGRKTEWA